MAFALGFRRHAAYVLKAYTYLPITYTKRVLLGKDPYWRQYFWSKWGFLARELKELVRGRPTFWLDAVGGGEVTQVVTFCRKLRERFPGHKIVLSSNNKYSLDFAATIPELDFVFDTPWDLKGPARRAVLALNPRALICIDNAPYPVLLREARRRGVRTILVSGIMSSGFWNYSTYRRALPMKFFRHLDAIGVKDEEDREGYVMTGAEPEKIRVVGNMKYDIDFIKIDEKACLDLRVSLGWGGEDHVLVAGCIRAGEDRIMLEAYALLKERFPCLRLIMAPSYDSNPTDSEATAREMGVSFAYKSKIGPGGDGGGDIVWVDTFGELSRLYGVGDVNFIGASIIPFHLGHGHNIIEPLIHGRPIFFGRHMRRWEKITGALKNIWPGFEVVSAEELARGIEFILGRHDLLEKVRRYSESVTAGYRDSVERNVAFVCEALSKA